ncbi:hypothetical protein EYF80_010083 [Liparis tanakae]|uniref:Uncharacterized protein n=1 Tax=Liparis tanakae TaxID=230148 RepID=A0A4Z2INV9_9TELE|nr:hypothetical protein EYF80_010083 [Liparis tanakae]
MCSTVEDAEQSESVALAAGRTHRDAVEDIPPRYLLQRVQGAVWVDVLLAEGLHTVAADDWILELLQPGPHQTGEDQRISLHAQPLPRSLSGVQLRLHIANKEQG